MQLAKCMDMRTLVLQAVVVVILARGLGGAAAADSQATDPFLGRADALLHDPRLSAAQSSLSLSEKRALGQALSAPKRVLKDEVVVGLLRNPVAYGAGQQQRALFGTIIRSLPDVADVKGVNETLTLAAKPNESLMRGHGTEVIAAAALNRFVDDNGQRACITRIGGDIHCADGRLRESDGAALIGADGVPRLVTVKSISTPKAVSRSVKKATDQLALRNLLPNGQRKPGVLMLGYDDPLVLEQLKRKDWRAAATRTGAKLLVIAVHHHTGQTEKLASFEPDATSSVRPKPLPPSVGVGHRIDRTAMRAIGRASPQAAQTVARWRRTLGQRGQAARNSLFGLRARWR